MTNRLSNEVSMQVFLEHKMKKSKLLPILQCAMRIFLEDKVDEMIENYSRFSTFKPSLRKSIQ